MDKLLTIKEVRTQLWVSWQTVKRMIERGELEAIRAGIRGWRIPERSLQQYIQHQRKQVETEDN